MDYKETIKLVSRNYRSVEVFVYGYDDDQDENSDFCNVLKKLFDLKNDEGKTLFREGLDGSLYVPIKMTQEGRPNRTTPEFREYIGPWIRKIVADNRYHWEKIDRSRFKDKVNDLRAIVYEIDMAGDLSKYNCDAIREGIDRLEKLYNR